jgi:hypothetical protein
MGVAGPDDESGCTLSSRTPLVMLTMTRAASASASIAFGSSCRGSTSNRMKHPARNRSVDANRRCGMVEPRHVRHPFGLLAPNFRPPRVRSIHGWWE